jgi:hypothetical protein
MKLFQVVRDGSLWAVFAVSASDPNDRELVRNWTSDEQFAIDLATKLNRIAATHEGDETDLTDLTSELGEYDPPRRIVRFED